MYMKRCVLLGESFPKARCCHMGIFRAMHILILGQQLVTVLANMYYVCTKKKKKFVSCVSFFKVTFSITPYNPLNIILYICNTFNLPSLLNTQYSTCITYSAVAAYQSLLLYQLYQFMSPVILKMILLHIVYLLSYSALMPAMHHTAVICLLE